MTTHPVRAPMTDERNGSTQFYLSEPINCIWVAQRPKGQEVLTRTWEACWWPQQERITHSTR